MKKHNIFCEIYIIAAAILLPIGYLPNVFCEQEMSLEGARFEYNGHVCEVKHPDIRNNKVVFYSNLYYETPVSYFTAPDGKKIPLNFKVFVADLSGSQLINIKRLSIAESGHETDPFWLDKNNVIYMVHPMGGTDSTYRVSSVNGENVKNGLKEEYENCKRRANFFTTGPSVIRVLRIPNYNRDPCDRINAMDFSSDGKYLAAVPACDNVGNLTIWDMKNFSIVASIPWNEGKGGLSWSNDVVFSPDSKYLALSCYNSVRFWDTGNFKLANTMDKNCAIAFRPDGKFIVTNEGVFNFPELSFKKKIYSDHIAFVYNRPISFSLDGKYLLTTFGLKDLDFVDRLIFNESAVRIMDASTFEMVKTIKGDVWSARFNPNCEYLIATCDGLHLYDLKSFKEIKRVKELGDYYERWVFSSNGNYLIYTDAISDSKEPLVKILNMKTFAVQYIFKAEGPINTFAVSPDGCYLAMAGKNGSIYILDVEPLAQ